MTDHTAIVRQLVASITPFDAVEADHQEQTLQWIDSGAPLCRTKKPSTPPQHLVSYALVIDADRNALLLADHKKALLWLPTGGHVEPDEDPTETAHRELKEELNVELPLYSPRPFFVTVTQTVGITAGHTDVSLWYLYHGNSSATYLFDPKEFNQVHWFSINEIPLERTDPHMDRLCKKWIHDRSKTRVAPS